MLTLKRGGGASQQSFEDECGGRGAGRGRGKGVGWGVFGTVSDGGTGGGGHGQGAGAQVVRVDLGYPHDAPALDEHCIPRGTHPPPVRQAGSRPDPASGPGTSVHFCDLYHWSTTGQACAHTCACVCTPTQIQLSAACFEIARLQIPFSCSGFAQELLCTAHQERIVLVLLLGQLARCTCATRIQGGVPGGARRQREEAPHGRPGGTRPRKRRGWTSG